MRLCSPAHDPFPTSGLSSLDPFPSPAAAATSTTSTTASTREIQMQSAARDRVSADRDRISAEGLRLPPSSFSPPNAPISVVVHFLCWILVFMHATKPPMQGNAIPKSCCTSMNYEKILGYSGTLILIFIAVIVKQIFTKKSMGTKVGALILCFGLFGMTIRIVVTSKQEEEYYGANFGFWWHANWFTIGMLLALALKAWQYSDFRKIAYTYHEPILTAAMFALLVTMNLIFYYSNDLSWVNPELWNVKQVFGNYPIGHLYARGGNQFVMSMVFWNALTLVEIIEGPFFVLFMLIITLNANLR